MDATYRCQTRQKGAPNARARGAQQRSHWIATLTALWIAAKCCGALPAAAVPAELLVPMDRANGAGAGPGAAANRAERFEDEKRRIIESCFGKKDVDGSLLETYITHIRITEYSSYPSTPPPPEARGNGAEKPRVIIVAVRKSGRVRMHKSKENANGSYSIGKTWSLDDLTHIASYTGPQDDPNHRQWAGDTGFLVTLGKAYYWQAQTDKEKKFFIASLIKIYGKYTGGKVPELSGFEPREFDQVMGAGRRPPPPANRPPPPHAEHLPSQPPGQPHRPPGQPHHPPGQPNDPPSRPRDGPSQPRDGPSQPGQQTQSSSSHPPAPPPLGYGEAPRFIRTPPVRPPPNGTSSPAGSFDSSASRERAPPRWMALSNKSQDSVANSFATRSEDSSSLPPRSRNGMAPPAGLGGRFAEPETRPPPGPVPQPPQPRHPQPENPPPERRRPPMDPSRPNDRDLVPPPLISPGVKRELVAPPPRSSDRTAPRKDTVSQQTVGTSLNEGFKGRDTPPLGLSSLTKGRDTPPPPATRPLEVSKPEPLERPAALKTPSSISLPVSVASSSPAPPTDAIAPPPPELPADPEDSRPGLGPMIKNKKTKNEIAGALWKAASAAAAFKPRPGGAGDRLRQAVQTKPEEGPDGITDVIPAPPRPASRGPLETLPELPKSKGASERNSLVPEVKITVPNSSRPNSLQAPIKEVKKADEHTKDPVKEPIKEPVKDDSRRSVITGNDAKYLQSLGIDPSLLDNRSDEFGKWLDYFGWVPGEQMRTRNVEEMKFDLDRELNKAQAGGWLARFREEDERVDAIKSGLDLAMTECEELDNLLTLYSVELSTLSDDIAYIEAQGQGLQVQTANQKLLRKELESLLETCAITEADLQALRLAPLENVRGLEDVETSLVTLFRAMMKIDPTIGGSDPSNVLDVTMDSDQTLGLNSNYGKMRIVQEKKEMYLQESGIFTHRLVNFMTQQFDEAYNETKKALDGALSKKVDATHHELGRDMLWKYSPLMLYARDADLENWNRLIQIYQDKSHPLYKGELQNVITIWRKNARKLTGEEAELLFTYSVEKHQEGVATTARKMTVKRSQTLARAIRSPLADGSNRVKPDKTASDSRSLPYEVFAGVLEDLLPLVEMEQNFIVDFFHATTLEQADFPDAVAARRPRDRRGGDLKRHRLMEPDRELARRVTRSMEVIFAFLEQELQRLMEWVIGQDPLQGVGVLASVEKKLNEIGQSNQDFLNTMLQKLHSFLEGRFKKFVDEQIRAIEETKVKINKRKGVISFIRVFPTFSVAVENMLVGVDSGLAARRTIDREYNRLLKAMFDSLMVIARENPTVSVTNGAVVDPEDKEALNFHILLIENMNHFLEETDTRGLEILEEWKDQADATYQEHMDLYLNAVMRRPLGKVLDHLENIEAQLQSGKSPSSIAGQPSNSKNIFNKVLGNYDSKEVRKGIEALRKRVDKHFGDADDPALSRGLVVKVMKECETFYGNVESRIGRITTDVVPVNNYRPSTQADERMPPQTRSRGVPPPSRVYNSTPAQQQAQFLPRRRVIRTYGKQPRTPKIQTLRQQTLTQIDFVSSFEEEHDPIVLSDSDDDDADQDTDEDKENRYGGPDLTNQDEVEDAHQDDDDEPVSSVKKRRAPSKKATAQNDRTKRRRTLGDDTVTKSTTKTPKAAKAARRKTTGDAPASTYHTQTLTQFLGRDPTLAEYIKDSGDENEDEPDDGFQNWLKDPTSPSPRRKLRSTVSPKKPKKPSPSKTIPEEEHDERSREESVVLQTPTKHTKHTKITKHARFEIPSSTASSPLSTPPPISTPDGIMIDRYGPPDVPGPSPLKNVSSSTPAAEIGELSGVPTHTPKRLDRVIQDSFATESWGSGDVTPTPLRTLRLATPILERSPSKESSSLAEEVDTPTKPRRRRQSEELGKTDSPTPKKTKRVSPGKKTVSPKKGKRVVLEIPDSDEEEFEGFSEDDAGDENANETPYVAGPETQFVMNEIASSEEYGPKATPTPTPAPINHHHATRSSAASASSKPPPPSTCSPPVPSSQPTTPPIRSSPPALSHPPSAQRLRKPLPHVTSHAMTPTQPLESQRVPLSHLQALEQPSMRTDILLPLSPATLAGVLGGYQTHVALPFKIPAQVVRFWLFDGELLRYMACVEPRRLQLGAWRYELGQVYELNNPMDSNGMHEEEWFEGPIGNYVYLPPAVVGQLLWNLRHAVFGEDVDDDDDEHNQGQDETENQVILLPDSSSPPKKAAPAPTPTPSITLTTLPRTTSSSPPLQKPPSPPSPTSAPPPPQ
ncbi:hypothetical protein G7046_g5673 [Stylonectria norvegica]|nr:hypothetical protein G7046_g5673 [Stylonectria norvegica]